MNVLYVEDNQTDINLTRQWLTRQKANIVLTTCSTLAEARGQLFAEACPFDLVLLDLRLPDGNGFELLRQIRQENLPVAVVILTGSGDEETAVNALKAGADNYLTKRERYLAQLPQVLEETLSRVRATARTRRHELRVLYGEHNLTDGELTQIHLGRHAPHVQLETVLTAEAFIAHVTGQEEVGRPYDVLLADFHIPDMGALALLKYLQEELKVTTPIVFITGMGNEEDAVQCLRLGAANYLVKSPGYLFQLPSALENAFYLHELQEERRRLQASEARFRLLAENARDVIFRFRLPPDLGFEYVSPAVADLLGYTPEDFYADPLLGSQVVHPDDEWLSVYLSESESLGQHVALRFLRQDGETVWVELHNNPVYDENNQLIALEGIARDITQRQQAMTALNEAQVAEKEQRQLAEALRDTAAALIAATDLEAVMHTILANVYQVVPHDAANIMLIQNGVARPVYWRGYRPEREEQISEISFIMAETINLRIMQETAQPCLISHTDMHNEWLEIPLTSWVKSFVAAPIRAHGAVIGFLCLDSGQPGYFQEVHAQRLQAFADQASLAIEHAELYDQIRQHNEELEERVAARTAELQHSEAQLKQMLEHAIQLSSLRSTYMSMAAHDLRNPLTAIQTAVQLLERHGEQLSAERKATKYSQIYQSVKTMVQMLDDILTIGQVESGKLSFHPALIDLDLFVGGIIDEIRQITHAKQTIILTKHGDCRAAYVDPKLLRHLLTNLLTNASKYSPAGSQIQFEMHCADDAVVFKVTDQGIGIPPAAQARLYEPFHRAGNVREIPGTGLGLAIVKQATELHGGTIECASEENEGTTFTVRLPRQQAT